jgi:hypothetical protein
MENNNMLKKSYSLIIIPIFVFITIVIIIIYRANIDNHSTSNTSVVFPTPVPLLYKSAEVKNIEPNYSQALVAGKIAVFTVTFSESVLNQGINILLQEKALGTKDETAMSVPLTQTLQSKGSQIAISTVEPIEALKSYTLIITNRSNKTLLSATYSSSSIVITPVPSNNLELKKYLPYETSMYKLTYNKTRNEYVFNFKINPTSSQDLQSQFNSAKQQAEDFIKSKGIDINSIVIDWRHS